MTGKKRKVTIYFAVFLLVMLVCTVVSRGVYAYQMPRIQVGYPERATITKTVEGDGVVEAAEEIPVVVKDGIRIAKVNVAPSQLVEPGQVLLTLDVEDLSQMVEKVNQELSLIQLKQQELTDGRAKQESQQNQNIARAKEDLSSVTTNQETQVQMAQQEYDAAVNAMNAHPGLEPYLAAAQAADPEYQEKRAAAQAEGADDQTMQDFQSYEAQFNQRIQNNWNEECRVLEETRAEKQKALEAAKAASETAIKEAQRALEDAQETTGGEAGTTTESSTKEVENEQEEKQKELEEYQSLLNQNGEVTSPVAASVQAVNVSAGGKTTDEAAIMLGDLSGGYSFQGKIQAADRELLKVGDTMQLIFDGGRTRIEEVQAVAIDPQEDGTYLVEGMFQSKDVSVGQAGTMRSAERRVRQEV